MFGKGRGERPRSGIDVSSGNVNSVNRLKLLYTNCDSLPNKMEELKVYIEELKPHIIALTECIPKNVQRISAVRDELICSLQIEGYELYHNWSSVGRGVALYVDNNIKSSALQTSFSSAGFVGRGEYGTR